MTFRRILVALDGSKRSERALPWVRLLAKDQDLVLLRVIEQDYALDVYAGAALPDLLSEVERYLHRVASEFEVRPRLVARVGSVSSTIAEVARECKAELIALTTHGSSELTRWIFGGTAEKLARASDTPLLVVPSWEEIGSAPKIDKVAFSDASDSAAAMALRFEAPAVAVRGDLLQSASQEQADLLIAPTRPRRWWKADETRSLLRAASIPILLVRGAPIPAAA